MMKNRRNRRSPMAEINVVPYIDVMLVLLIIFMVTTPLLSQGVNVDLPHATSKPLVSKQQEPVIVSIDAQGRYFLNISPTPDQPIDATELTAQVSAAVQAAQTSNEPRQVLVKGDQSANYGQIMQAMVLLQQAGVPGVGLVTVPLEQGKK